MSRVLARRVPGANASHRSHHTADIVIAAALVLATALAVHRDVNVAAYRWWLWFDVPALVVMVAILAWSVWLARGCRTPFASASEIQCPQCGETIAARVDPDPDTPS